MSSKLSVTTPGDREIVMKREFDAPRHLVFRAVTTPELLKRWLLGPDGWSLEIPEFDVRVGGRFKYTWTSKTKPSFSMHGVFEEVTPPERIVHTELFEQDWTNGETLVTSELTEAAGKTHYTMTIRYGSKETRDTVLKTGMTNGVAISYDRLDAVLAAELAHTR